jgi:hypothetical protein
MVLLAGTSRAMRGLRSWALWWVALFLLWNLLQGAWEEMEIAAGAGAAALGATLAEYARRQGLLGFAPDGRRFVRALRVFWRVPYEFAVVTAALVLDLLRVRPVRSEWSTAPLPGGDVAAVRHGNHAAVLAAENVAPNTMAIDAEVGDVALKHDLVPGHGNAVLPQ